MTYTYEYVELHGGGVVYHCNGEWDNFMSYTSALTSLIDLKLGWKHS